VNRVLQASRQYEGSDEEEPAADGRHDVADIHAISPLDDLMTSYTNARPRASSWWISTSARPQDSSRHD